MSLKLLSPSSAAFVSRNCKLRLFSTATPLRTSASVQANSPSTPSHAHLTSRSLIKLQGPDAGKFLHDLLPAKILDRPPETDTQPIYTVFMNAHGRILHDVFIYPPQRSEAQTGPWFIEVDSDQGGFMMRHLKKHKLRSKFLLERTPPEALSVYYTWPHGEVDDAAKSLGGSDPRAGMGSRWVLAPEQASKSIEEMSGRQSVERPLKDYTVHRMMNGIAEGQSEIISASALPMECNIEFFGGIDFHKGCYLGQELTIRTHHTGVVRKRILPCQIYDKVSMIEKKDEEQQQIVYRDDTTLPIPPSESNLTKASARGKGRSIGKWLGGVGNIGLALCRLEVVTDIQLTEESTHFDPNEEFKVTWQPEGQGTPREVIVKPILLPWLRQAIMDSAERRQRKPRKAEPEEDVD